MVTKNFNCRELKVIGRFLSVSVESYSGKLVYCGVTALGDHLKTDLSGLSNGRGDSSIKKNKRSLGRKGFAARWGR